MPANPWLTEEIKHKTLRQRLFYLIDNCHGVIVLPGGIGTLSELALIWSSVQVGERRPLPIVVVGGLWQRTLAAFSDDSYIQPAHRDLIVVVRTASEAVREIVDYFKRRGRYEY
jgi:hypothetical protein